MADVTLTPVDFNPFAGATADRASWADLKVSPDVQIERDKVRLAMLQDEQQNATNDDPQTAAARQREIDQTSKNIANGTPWGDSSGKSASASRGTQISSELKAAKRGPKPLFPLTEEQPQVTLEPVNFDPFAAPAPTGGPGFAGRAKDTALDLAKGTVSLGEAAVGVGDIASFGTLGKSLAALGYDPKTAQEFLSGLQTDARQKSEAEVQKATGFWDTAKALGVHPDVLIGNIVQSLPGTVASGALAGQLVRRLASTAATEAASLGLTGEEAIKFVAGRVKDATFKIAAAASGAEGAQSAGSIAEAGRQSGAEWRQYVSPALAAGLGTTAIGIASGGLARKLGIGDVETDIAARAAGAKGVGVGAQGFVKRVPLEAAKEGILEELPQSAQEKMFENLATGRPPGEGVAAAGAQGMMAGAGMGGGHAALSGGSGAPAAVQPAQGDVSAPDVNQQPVAASGPIEPVGLTATQQSIPYPGQPEPSPYTRTAESLAVQPPSPLPPPMSRVEQARVDAKSIQSGSLPADIDETRINNARLVSVYGENPAVRHVIESGNMGALGQAMLAVAPQVERVRATIQQGQESRDITTDVMTAIDEIARIRKDGRTVAEVMANGFPGQISYEGQQLVQYLDTNMDKPEAIAKFMENYLQVVEDMGGVPSDVRGKAFDIIAERKATKREQEKAQAFAQKEGVDAQQKKTETQIATEQARAENALTEMARARVAGAGVNPEHQTALEIAFANAKPLKGKPNAKQQNSEESRAGGAKAGPNKQPGTDQAGARQGRVDATGRQERVSQRAGAGDQGNAQPVRASSDQPRPQDEPVGNRGAEIAAERKEKSYIGKTISPQKQALTPEQDAKAKVEAASAEAAHSPANDKPLPTAAQHEAGNYAKGHVKLFGLDITIENPTGSVRMGVGPDGKPWAVKMTAPYGYLKKTEGGDGEHIDVYLGDKLTENMPVFVIDQIDPSTKRFDEHKVVLGARGYGEAKDIYDNHFSDDSGEARRGAVTKMSLPEFKDWLKGDTTAAVKYKEPAARPDRREDAAERKRIEDMTPEELRRAILTDTLTGLPNRRAYEEAEKLAVQVSADADSLKWINDNMGHDAGDKMLQAIGEAFQAETDQAYHISGDEFVVQAATPDEAAVIMKSVQERLASAILKVQLPSGEQLTVNGIGISHGTGNTLSEAEVGLQRNKQEREDAGLRRARGSEPPGAVRSNGDRQGQQTDQRDAPAKSDALAQPEPKKKQPVALTKESASRLARQFNEQGTPTQVIPHPTVPGKFTLFKRDPRLAPGMEIGDVKAEADRLRKTWANAPAIKIVQSVGDLPFAAPALAKGAYSGGKVWLVADELSSPAELQQVLFHEMLGHAGLRGALGDGIANAMLDIERKNLNVSVRAMKWREKNKDIRGNRTDEQWNANSIEEALADMAGEGKQIKGIDKFLAAVQSALRAIGLDAVANWMEKSTNAEALRMLAAAKRYIENGEEVSVFGQLEVAAFNRGEQAARYEPNSKHSGPVPEIKYLPVSAIERQEMDFRPEVMTVSDEVANNMDYSQPIEVTAYRYGKTNDDNHPAVTLIDGHHRTAAALQTGRKYLPVQVKAINAKGAKLNALIELSRQIEETLVDQQNPMFSRGAHFGDLTQAQQDALRNVHGEPTTWKQRLDTFKSGWKKDFVQGVFDQYAPILDYSKKGYILARMAKGGDSTLEAMLMYGKPYVDKDGAYRVEYDKHLGMQGFAKVIAGLNGEHDRFLEWVAANRAERLASIGLENLYSAADIAALKSLDRGTMKDGADRAAAYAKAMKQLNDWNDTILKIAADSGLIDDATRQMYKDQPYVPFYRLQDEGVVQGFGMKAGLVNQSAWKKLKGGTDKLNDDLLANLLQNWSHMITASAKNRAARETLTAAEQAGIAEEVPAGTPGKGLVHYMDAGAERVFSVSDDRLVDAIAAMHYAGLGAIGKPFIAMKRALTIGVTVNPAFKIRNLLRDTISAIGTSELSYNPGKNLAQGFKATAMESETRAQMLAAGGMIRFGSMLDGNNADRTRRLIEQNVDPDMILDSAGKLEKFFKQRLLPAFEAYQELGDRGEQMNRAALYEQLSANGMSHGEAAFWARDLMDFSMSGKWGAVRILTQVVPFMNARLQGLYKLGRAGAEDYKRMATVVGAVSLASMALLLAYGGDDDWKKREDWDRDNFWWFKIGDMAFRVPKPFEIGAIGTLAERSLEYMTSDEMTGKRFAERASALVFNQLSMNPTPQLLKPLLDIYANKDSFSGRPIETMGMEKLRKQDRSTEHTSQIAKALGQLGLPDPTQLAMGQWNTLSPVQIDSLLRGYFGWLGSSTTTALDYGIRPMMDRGQRPDMKLRDVFLAGNFVETLPTNSSRYVTQMYEQAAQIEQAYGSYRDALKRGDVAGAQQIKADEKDKIEKYHRIEAVKRGEAQITAQIKIIEASKTMPGDEKRVKIDGLNRAKDALAKVLATP